jgi:thioesterase DpgC
MASQVEFAASAAVFRESVARLEEALASLPCKPDRSAEQLASADALHRQCREKRARFMALHAREVYAAVGDAPLPGRHRPLSELLFRAAEMFPGLTPTRAQFDQERRYSQAEKEGREIDQGIFLRALFRCLDIAAEIADILRCPTSRALALLDEFDASGRIELATVHLQRQGAVAYLTFENGHCLNAEDDRLIDDMETAVDLVLFSDTVRVGVLRGGFVHHPRYAGKRVFSAGINLKELRRGQISYVDFLMRRELG